MEKEINKVGKVSTETQVAHLHVARHKPRLGRKRRRKRRRERGTEERNRE